MLTIEFWNISGPGHDAADYDVKVRVNGKLIAQETVTGHWRDDGWRALVRRLGRNEDTVPPRDDHSPAA